MKEFVAFLILAGGVVGLTFSTGPAVHLEKHLEQYHTSPGTKASVSSLKFWPVSARAADSIRYRKALDAAIFYAQLKVIAGKDPADRLGLYAEHSRELDSLTHIADSLLVAYTSQPRVKNNIMCTYIVQVTGAQVWQDTFRTILNDKFDVIFSGF